MEHSYILSILYEMSLVIGGEVSVKPLLTRMLQRMLYHTSFPAGFVCLDVPSPVDDSADMIEVRIDAAVGDYELAALIGQMVRLPAKLLRGVAERGEDAALLARLPDKVRRHKAYLRLPIDGQGVIVLLAPQLPDTDLPLTQLFQPVMANLAKAIVLCSHHDAYTGGLIAARDASQQAQAASEEKFRAISAAVLDALIMVDDSGALAYWNPAAERILGYRADEVLGKPLHQLLAPQRYQSSAVQGFDAFRNTGQGAVIGKTIEIEALRKDGREIPVELSIAALKLNGHWNAVGILRDITERKVAEEELRRYKNQLEEKVELRTADLVLARNAAEAANRAKSVFLSSMSHEFRTPLNAILGFSSMVRKDPLLPLELRDNLDIINRSGENLLTLINGVLEMSKIEAGRVQVAIAPFDLGALVRDVTDMMHMRAQEKGLQLLVDQSSEFPRYIKGDEARLRQVLINLVGNAVKFTRQGGIAVRFGLKPHVIPQRLLIEVEDSGIGINAADQQKIFEPFVQLKQTATEQGTGLGLTITRQFVQLMGGAISVESTSGKGSIFRVELPVERVEASDVTRQEGVIKGEVEGLAPGQPEYRILIVEDQLENQLLLIRLMKSVGFQVKVADNGEQALGIFQSWRPHLIWMDRRMPVMDGLEAARRIRELPGGADVKIVAVTASAFAEQRVEMLDAGMDDFVRKPYRFNEIYECLTKQLGVQYTYNDANAAEDVCDEVLTAKMLAVLPQDMRCELQDALESLEGERIADVIGQAASYDAKLYKTLTHLAENFDYPAILKALQTS
ncbi:MAG: ATP-binding protein [Gallionella sp.]|jgi:PAS domain S-box-containing protein